MGSDRAGAAVMEGATWTTVGGEVEMVWLEGELNGGGSVTPWPAEGNSNSSSNGLWATLPAGCTGAGLVGPVGLASGVLFVACSLLYEVE